MAMLKYNKTLLIATYCGRGKLFNYLVRWLDRTRYSHMECAVRRAPGGWQCWSSSFMDGGVRCKIIDLSDPEKWDITPFPVTDEEYARALDFAYSKKGQPYDTVGMLGAAFMIPRQDKRKQFCNELVLGMLGIEDPHRFRPASARILVQQLAKLR